MVDRKRSIDGSKEAQEIAENAGIAAEGGQQGRAGGRLARQVGTKDELKRAFEQPAGVTRVTKSDEQDEGETEKKD
jgi:hypothetical protein